ncbi:MAG: hypothetical protein HY340_01305 [Candidatus Kerfeldbacteria bacterium]|nr:hypothetical protein [Candidatus Kerfeldbacteria bacterium]
MARRGLILLALFILFPAAATAVQVSVSAVVIGPSPPTPADTVVIFRGIAYPNSRVTIQRQDEILVIVPAGPDARFDVELGNQPTGTSTYTIFAEDAPGVIGRESNFTLMITQGTTTTISGIFLGPTIGADRSTLNLGDTITILGVTAPESRVTIYVESEVTRTFQVSAGRDGLWTKQLLGSDIGVGDHQTRAKAVAPTEEISTFSKTIPFTVTEGAVDPCDGRNRADINCDGKINLTDFSILLFYWKVTNPLNPRADINRDRIVTLTDLSILLFNWTR